MWKQRKGFNIGCLLCSWATPVSRMGTREGRPNVEVCGLGCCHVWIDLSLQEVEVGHFAGSQTKSGPRRDVSEGEEGLEIMVCRRFFIIQFLLWTMCGCVMGRGSYQLVYASVWWSSV